MNHLPHLFIRVHQWLRREMAEHLRIQKHLDGICERLFGASEFNQARNKQH